MELPPDCETRDEPNLIGMFARQSKIAVTNLHKLPGFGLVLWPEIVENTSTELIDANFCGVSSRFILPVIEPFLRFKSQVLLVQDRSVFIFRGFLMKQFIPLLAAMAVLWCGCGGGSKSTTSTTVAVTVSPTTASIAGGATQQFTATVTGSTNTAVTWSVNGAVGGNALIGTISTSGLYTAPTVLPTTTTESITATSQADTTKIATAILTLTPPTVTITISPTSVGVPAGGQQQFTKTITSSDNNTAVTWSVNGCSAAATCGTVDQTGLYTSPLAPPREAITVTVASVSDSAFSASAPVTVQFSNKSLQGNYVFLATQGDSSSGGFALRAGSFIADGAGNIKSGVEDSNSSAGASAAIPFTGTYSVGTDGRGTMTINDGAAHTFAFALTSSTRGQMIGFDSGVASGLIRQQDQTAIAGVSGPFVFSLSGDNGGPSAAVGQLNFNTGNLITGSEDSNTGGSLTQNTPLAGSFSVPTTGRGTAVVNSSNFAYYIIDANTLALIDIDSAGARLAGTAYAQSTSAFTTASLGSSAYFVDGNAVSGGKPYAQAGRFDTDGRGSLGGGVFDINNAGSPTTNTPFSSGASYTLSSSAPTNGRGTISTGFSNFIFWLASPKQGVILQSDTSVVAGGLLFQQLTGITSITGGFEFVAGGTSADGSTPQAVEGQLGIAGFGGLSGTEDVNSGGNTQSSIAINPTSTLPPASNGRGVATFQTPGITGIPATLPFDFYFITADRFIMVSASSGSVLAGTGERQCSDCQF